MTRIVEHPQDFRLKVIRLIIGIPVVDPRKLHTDTRLLVELLSDSPGKHGRDKSFEGDTWLVDDRLGFVHHFLLRLN